MPRGRGVARGRAAPVAERFVPSAAATIVHRSFCSAVSRTIARRRASSAGVHRKLPPTDARRLRGDVPIATAGEAATSFAGDFAGRSLMGDLAARSLAGDLAARLAGDLAARSLAGDLAAARSFAGDLAARSLAGDLAARCLAGDLVARCLAGDVDARFFAGDLAGRSSMAS